jgi:hypothetical protein
MIGGVSATPDVLWPPSHKSVQAMIDYTVTGRRPNTCALSVASKQPVDGTGDGNTSSDWKVIDAQHVSWTQPYE